MIKYMPARLLGGLLFAATALAPSAPSFAVNDEPAQLTEDVSDKEIMPPGGEKERSDGGSGESSEAPRRGIGPANSTPQVDRVDRVDGADRVERVDREAAKRALLSDPKTEKPNPLLDTRGPDYYDRRAKELLKADSDKGRVDLHPLMQAHPDSYVVVCTAGCPSRESAQIVSMQPMIKPKPAAPANTSQSEISCVGGCGASGAASFASAPQPVATPVAATVGEWMTTVATAPAGSEPPALKSAGSGDWMDKINRDRDAAKAAPSVAKPQLAAPSVAKAEPAAPAVSAQAKPASVADSKPAAVVESKPAEAKTVTAEAKPATAPVTRPDTIVSATPFATAPVPTVKVEAKAEVAQPKSALTMAPKLQTVAEAKPEAITPAKPAMADALKPQNIPQAKADAAPTPVSTDKPATASPAPQQMAALETPKAPAAPVAPAQVSPATPAQSAKQDVASPAAKPDPVSPAASVTAGQASADLKPKPAPESKVETKVAALEPPTATKPAAVVPPAPKERVMSVLSEDKDMNAAIEKARGSLTAFWKSYDAPSTGETDHALKVAVAGNGTTEHFWLTRIKRDGGKLSGVISNQPQSVKTVKVGQRYEFTDDMISDWTFKRNGKLVGNETMRVLLPRMPEEQASVYRQMYETPYQHRYSR